jgi:hypothetical protein
MSETQVQGPIMINSTRVLKSDGIRIGRISRDIVLPRTVRLITAVAVGAGMAVGLLVALIFAGSLNTYMYMALIGGGIGYAGTTYSPIRGETLGTWVTLQLTSARSNRRIDGKAVTLSVGVAPVKRLAAGPIQLRRSSIRVAPGAVDERGVLTAGAPRYSAKPEKTYL